VTELNQLITLTADIVAAHERQNERAPHRRVRGSFYISAATAVRGGNRARLG
jgi:hypothetical protein